MPVAVNAGLALRGQRGLRSGRRLAVHSHATGDEGYACDLGKLGGGSGAGELRHPVEGARQG